jgi:hypothetical protein
MSTTEILRGYGRKLSAVALALGLLAAPRAQAVGHAGLAAAPAAGAVKRAAATKLAKAKKKKKKAADSGGDTGSSDASDAGDTGSGGSDDDRESALLASPKKKAAASDKKAAASDDDDDSSGSGSATRPAGGTRASGGARASASDDGDSSDDGTKVTKRASRPAVQEEPSEPAEAAGTALEIGFGGMALFRNLVWTSDAAAAQLGPYSLTPGPEAGLWLEFYPAAFVTSSFASNIGLYARYAYGFGVTSTLQSGVNAATSYQDFVAGLKVRLPLGTFTPYGTLAYGEQQFSLAPQGNATDLPAMDYSFVRIGLGTRIQFSPIVGLDVGAAFLSVTNAGSGLNQLASTSYFPQTSAYAMEAGSSLAIRLSNKIGVRLGADFRQYGMAFNPQPGAPRQVTGAVDRYIVAWSGLEVLIDGMGATSDDAPAASPAPKHRRHHTDEDSDDDSKSDDSKSDDSKSDDKPSKSSDDE